MKTYFGPNGDPNFGRCTLTCHHALRRSQNIVIDGVVMNGNCYTYPLILPDVDIENLQATSFNSQDHAIVYDDKLIEECTTATTDTALSALELELHPKSDCIATKCQQLRISKHFDNIHDDNQATVNTLQTALDATPFRELIL